MHLYFFSILSSVVLDLSLETGFCMCTTVNSVAVPPWLCNLVAINFHCGKSVFMYTGNEPDFLSLKYEAKLVSNSLF